MKKERKPRLTLDEYLEGLFSKEGKCVGEEPKSGITIQEALDSLFPTNRGLGRKPRSPMEKLTTGSDGQTIQTIHVYGDRRNLAIIASEAPAGVNLVHHPTIASGEIYKAKP